MTNFQPNWASFIRKKTVSIMLLAVLMLVVSGFAWAYKKVAIVADGQTISVETLHINPIEVLRQEHIVLGSEDEYRMSTAALKNGTVLTVHRAVPVTVVYQGKEQIVNTAKPTVREAAASMGIPVGQVRLVPDGDAPLIANMKITAYALTENMTIRHEREPFTIVRQPDPTLEQGSEEIEQDGRDGSAVVTVRQFLVDGRVEKEEVVSRSITTAPVNQIVRVGTRNVVETSRGASHFRHVVTMEATAYNPWDGSGSGITASGMKARRGVVAVDPSVIPLGSRLFIPGYGFALAADTGGSIVGARIDLCMDEYREAISFGRRSVKVYILE